MSEKISNIILEIESRFTALKGKLHAEVAKNEQLNLELENLKTNNLNLTGSISTLTNDLYILKEENELLKNKVDSSAAKVLENKDVEIDFLVREIDQCINQIKNNL